jgi:hypothetical protein
MSQSNPFDKIVQKPTRVSLSLGSTTRLNEFDFSKISLSLDRDLAPNENPLDGFRGIHALLSKALAELQVGPKKASSGAGTCSLPEPKTQQSPTVSENHKPKESVIEAHNHIVPPGPAVSKPAGLTVETKWKSDLEIIHERLAKWLDKVEVTPTLNGFAVKPRHFLLRPTWAEIDTSLRVLGAKWIPAAKGVGSWHIAK